MIPEIELRMLDEDGERVGIVILEPGETYELEDIHAAFRLDRIQFALTESDVR